MKRRNVLLVSCSSGCILLFLCAVGLVLVVLYAPSTTTPKGITIAATDTASAPTHTAAPLPTPTPAPIILDFSNLLGKSDDEVEGLLGMADDEFVTTSDPDPESPQDVKTWAYYELLEGKYEVWVSFDKSGACIKVMMFGLAQHGYSLDQWDELFPRLGLLIPDAPDKQAPAARIWENESRYFIRVEADGINGKIRFVKVVVKK